MGTKSLLGQGYKGAGKSLYKHQPSCQVVVFLAAEGFAEEAEVKH